MSLPPANAVGLGAETLPTHLIGMALGSSHVPPLRSASFHQVSKSRPAPKRWCRGCHWARTYSSQVATLKRPEPAPTIWREAESSTSPVALLLNMGSGFIAGWIRL